MAETTNQLGLVQSVCSHFHSSHSCHLLVHLKELGLGDLNLKRRQITVVGVERVLMKFHCEWLSVRGAFL